MWNRSGNTCLLARYYYPTTRDNSSRSWVNLVLNNTKPIIILLKNLFTLALGNSLVPLKSFQFFNLIKNLDSNLYFAEDIFDGKTLNNSSIEYFSDSSVKHCCKHFVSKSRYFTFFYSKRDWDKLWIISHFLKSQWVCSTCNLSYFEKKIMFFPG